ncbi:MAG TPA: divergent polysaccharide deacetylase family protein [Roseiarcus sp.]
MNEPLGRLPRRRESVAARARRLAPRFVLWTALAGVAVIAADHARRSGPAGGGEPFAVAPIEAAPVIARAPVPAPAPTLSDAANDSASRVKVVRNGGGGSDALIIDVPKTLGVRLVAAPDKRLVETSRYGALPRIGADGARPADVYARPVVASARLKAGAPQIAILIGGLGISAEGTATAIARLPADVTLGFAPYGDELEREAAAARDAGHEIWLQAPMESFGGAADNPGPHTLIAAASDAENLDSLHWLMSRFTGYAGVVNYLGGKFTSDSRALSPVLAEIASRGLDYLDDGASPRSVAREAAVALNLPSGKADVVIDADPSPEGVEAALTRLEALARGQGAAIGVATARPASVERIARWAASLEARGVVLAPLSAIVSRVPGPAAQAIP